MTKVYRPFRPRFRFSHVTTRLRAWLPTSGASRLVWLPNRSKHTAHDHFETSLEEAAVSRPGREAGMKNGQTLRALKARHSSHALKIDDRDFFTASETRRTTMRERDAEVLHTEGREARACRDIC